VIQELTRDKGINLAGVKCILSLFDVIKAEHQGAPDDLRDVFAEYAEAS
jgi:hypothetical protein